MTTFYGRQFTELNNLWGQNPMDYNKWELTTSKTREEYILIENDHNLPVDRDIRLKGLSPWVRDRTGWVIWQISDRVQAKGVCI